MGDAKAKGIVAKKSLLKKITRVQDQLASLEYIIVTDIEEHQSADILSYPTLVRQASEVFVALLTRPDTPSVLHFTSGSTGKPKGVLHFHRSILHQSGTASDVLNLTESDIFWCTRRSRLGIGAPDELLYEKVVAFVHLHKQYTWSKELEVKIRLHVSNRASSIATPQEIIIVDSVPENKSGKIMRRVLKARHRGQDAGDISTLED